MTPPLRVRVVLPGDPYTGETGTVTRTIDDEDGLICVVRFCIGHNGDLCHTAYYRRGELATA